MPQNLSNIIVAISGAGRSLENLLSYCADNEQASFRISGVISSSSKAKGNLIAATHNLPLLIADFSKQNAQLDLQIADFIEICDPQWIALAGFLKVFPLSHRLKNHVINIHPALLPEFGGKGMFGLNVHKSVLEKKVTKTGATVHFASDRYDEGDVISQIIVNVKTTDRQVLADHVFEAECKLYPFTIDQICQGKLPLPNNKVYIYEHS